MKTKILLILLAIMSVFILGCQNTIEPKTLDEFPSQDIKTVTIENQTPSNQTLKEFYITARQWEFEPRDITVSQGDLVRLTITSVDVEHGFALPDFGIDERLNPGDAVVIEFIADKKGEFRFFCNVYCGAGHQAMEGKIIVE